MKPTILLDCDGPIFDFVGAVIQLIYDETDIVVNPTDFKAWDLRVAEVLKDKHPQPTVIESRVRRKMLEKGFCFNIAVCPEAYEGVSRLRTMAQVVFVTAPYISNSYWMNERFWALQRAFPEKGGASVIFAKDKTLIHGDVLVDDKTTTVDAWSTAWPTAQSLLWSTAQNGADSTLGRRVHSWQEVIDLVGSLTYPSRA